jgi:hypothetical protein
VIKSCSLCLSVVFALSFSIANAASPSPNCLGNNSQILPIDDVQVLTYKTTTPNQFLARAHIQGVLQHAYADKSGHDHFEIKIGSGPTDNIEVVYNQEFGSLPQLRPGMIVEACGDYITSNAATSKYPPSPDGAIVHWVHRANGGNHQSGYLVINGILCGQGSGNSSGNVATDLY